MPPHEAADMISQNMPARFEFRNESRILLLIIRISSFQHATIVVIARLNFLQNKHTLNLVISYRGSIGAQIAQSFRANIRLIRKIGYNLFRINKTPREIGVLEVALNESNPSKIAILESSSSELAIRKNRVSEICTFKSRKREIALNCFNIHSVDIDEMTTLEVLPFNGRP